MSVRIRPHSTIKGIYFVNDKQVITDSNGNTIPSEKLSEKEIKMFNQHLKDLKNGSSNTK